MIKPPTRRHWSELDPAEAAKIRNAVSFATHMRKGPLETYTIPCATLAEARKHAAELEAQHGQHGRRAVVYALDARNARTPVPASFKLED